MLFDYYATYAYSIYLFSYLCNSGKCQQKCQNPGLKMFKNFISLKNLSHISNMDSLDEMPGQCV